MRTCEAADAWRRGRWREFDGDRQEQVRRRVGEPAKSRSGAAAPLVAVRAGAPVNSDY